MHMKRLFLLILAASICLACTKDFRVSYPLSQEDALLVARKYIQKYEFYVISKDIVKASTVIPQGIDADGNARESFTTPDFDSWLIRIDTTPNVNDAFNERILLLFINVKNGKIKEYRTSIMFQFGDIEFAIKLADSANSRSMNAPKMLTAPPTSLSEQKWAVIISGGVNYLNNYSRYWQDCSDIYKTLVNSCGYAKANIYCLVSDGTDPTLDQNLGNYMFGNSSLDLDGDGTNDVQYSATKDNISTVFNQLQANVQSGDELFVFVTDHGNADGSLCLWGNNENITVSQFCAEVNKIPTCVRTYVLMGQCHSGAYIEPLSAQNRVIATACTASELSTGYAQYYDYFLHYWTYAINNESAGDSNGDGRVSIREAFEYASRMVTANQNCSEHPQYRSTPSDLGARRDLAGAYIYDSPTITGPSVLSTELIDCFTVSGLPIGAQIQSWSGTDILTYSTSGNSAYIYSDIEDVYTDDAKMILSYTADGFVYKKTLSDIQVWKPGTYFGDGYIIGSGTSYYIQNYPGTYGFQWCCNNTDYEIMNQGINSVELGIQRNADDAELSISFYTPRSESVVFERTITSQDL